MTKSQAATTSLIFEYSKALMEHVRDPSETTLKQAYELGRRAIADQVGLIELAGAHRSAISAVFGETMPKEQRLLLDKSFEFYAETLAVFEMVQRGYQEALDNIRHLNGELSKSVDQFRALNVELETFSYSVSHDLRAPLRVIIGYTDALVEQYGSILDIRGKDYLKRVKAGSERMSHLIDGLLSLSKIATGELSKNPVSLSSIAFEFVNELKELEPDRLIDISIAKDIMVKGDALLLRAAIGNLLNNSWKFTSKTAAAAIEFGVTEKDGSPTYFVRDNGAGFDMKYADKLFGVFQRLHSPTQFEGTGIGLATVQRIITRHGGKIWAEGAVGRGATFYFTLDPNTPEAA